MRTRGFYVITCCSQIAISFSYLFLLMPEVLSGGAVVSAHSLAMIGVGLMFGLSIMSVTCLAFPPKPAKQAKLTATDIIGSTAVWIGYATFMSLVTLDIAADRPGDPASSLGAAVGGMAVGLNLAHVVFTALFWLTRNDPEHTHVDTAAKEQHVIQG